MTCKYLVESVIFWNAASGLRSMSVRCLTVLLSFVVCGHSLCTLANRLFHSKYELLALCVAMQDHGKV